MPRTFHWKWMGLLALTLAPGAALAPGGRARDPHGPRGRHAVGSRQAVPRRPVPLARHLPHEHQRRGGSALDLPRRGAPAGRRGQRPAPCPAADTPEPPAAGAAVAEAPPAAPRPATWPRPRRATRRRRRAADARAAHRGLGQAPAGRGAGPVRPAPRDACSQESLKAYTHQPYRPLRRSEFYSSGFLTENQNLPFGKVLGPVTPQQIQRSSATPTRCPTRPSRSRRPSGATYQIGDTPAARCSSGPSSSPFGEVVIPTGLAQIVDTVQGRYVATVVATYGPIRNGQRVLPAEKFTPSGEAHAVPVTDGVRGDVPRRARPAGPQGARRWSSSSTRAARTASRRATSSRSAARAERLPDGRQLINERDGHAAGRARPGPHRHRPPAQRALARHSAGHRGAAGRQAAVLTSGSRRRDAAPGGSPAPRRFPAVPSSPHVSILRGGGSDSFGDTASEMIMARRGA